MGNQATKALVQTALTAVLWGTSFPVVAIGLRGGFDPRTFVFLRFAVAAPIMILYAAASGKKVLPYLHAKEIWVIGALNAAGFLFQFFGQLYTDASVAVLLVNVSVIMAAGGAVLFLGEKFGALKGAGVLLALAGTALVTLNGSLGGFSWEQLLGDTLCLLAAATWAGYIVYTKKKSEQLDWDPTSIAMGVVVTTAVLVLPVALTAGGTGFSVGVSLWAVGYTALVNTAIPYVLYQQGLRHLTVSSSAVVLTLEIVVAVAISVSFLGEVLSAAGWAGAAMILASILLVSGLELRKGTPADSVSITS